MKKSYNLPQALAIIQGNSVYNMSRSLRDDARINLSYCKIPKISPSKYMLLKLMTQKNPPLNHPSKYKPPRGFVHGNFPQMQSKQRKTVNFLPKIRLTQLILKNISRGVYFQNFTAYHQLHLS